jgi:hypothetical protein
MSSSKGLLRALCGQGLVMTGVKLSGVLSLWEALDVALMEIGQVRSWKDAGGDLILINISRMVFCVCDKIRGATNGQFPGSGESS